jgi:pseudaminic acid synthase
MPYEWQPKLKQIAEDLGLVFFSSPFDKDGVDFLEKMDVPIYKIASFEINDIPLIEYVALKGKPIIISTGVADLKDISLVLEVCRNVGNNQISLLKCTSEYPATIEMANLITIPDMMRRFGVKVGVSDHTMGNIVPIVAVALGAKIVEKHFILDRNMGGPDSAFSMEPGEFKDMVKSVREAESSLGTISYEISDRDRNRRRSLFVVKDINAGDTITEQNVRSLRPGVGLAPIKINEIIGRKVKVDIKKGTPLSNDFIE